MTYYDIQGWQILDIGCDWKAARIYKSPKKITSTHARCGSSGGLLICNTRHLVCHTPVLTNRCVGTGHKSLVANNQLDLTCRTSPTTRRQLPIVRRQSSSEVVAASPVIVTVATRWRIGDIMKSLIPIISWNICLLSIYLLNWPISCVIASTLVVWCHA